MILMAAAGELAPLPRAAVFADTGWEPRAVYEHLTWLQGLGLPFPIQVVRNGDIRKALTASEAGYVAVPFFLRGPDGAEGIGRRQCTHEYKLKPLRRAYREMLGKGPRDRIPAGAVESWIGISVDEVFRLKPADVAWCVNRWPLIEKRMTRADCLAWLERQGYPRPPKSSCIGCPYHSTAHWAEMKAHSPEEFADAVEVDRLIRTGGTQAKGEQFMHPKRIPLDEVDLSTAEDHGQLDLFLNECEGMCGV